MCVCEREKQEITYEHMRKRKLNLDRMNACIQLAHALHVTEHHMVAIQETMPHAVAKARENMKPGAWLVSLEFEATELTPTAVVQASADRPVWLYQAPCKPAPIKPVLRP